MNVPKLRFKEFNDEWINNCLSDIATITMGQSPSSKNYTSNKNNIILIQGNADLNNGHVVPRIFTTQITKTCNINDIIITVRAPVGDTAISDYNACIGRGVCAISGGKYIYHYLNYLKINDYWKKISKGSTIDSITSNDIRNLNINFPNSTETKKIVKTLDLLDKKIELQSKKIEDLKLFKKGLINVLNKKSYRETTLGKIGKFQTSSIDKLVKENEKIVSLYNYMDVYKHKIIMTQDLSKLSKTSAKDNQIITNNLKRGDILFTPSSETPDDIGHSICIQENLPNTVYSYHLLRYRPNIIIDPLFSNYYFNNSKIRKQIIRYATGATRYTVSLDSFLKIKVDIPDLITQKKYGLLLYSTDKKVNKEMFKLNKLQELKKGLMQDMFV